MFPFWMSFDLSSLMTAVPALLVAAWAALSITTPRAS